MIVRSTSVIAIGIAAFAASASATMAPGRSLLDMENRTTAIMSARSNVENDYPIYSYPIYSYCGGDIVGGDQWVARYPDPDSCVANCLPQTGCNAATWTRTDGGTCYFKRLDKGASPDIVVVPKMGAISFMRKDDIAPGQSPHPELGVDMPGNDLVNYPANQPGTNLCPSFCYADPRCFAYTYTNYNGGTCWLKTKPSQYAPSGRFSYSAVREHQVNPNYCLALV